MGNNLDGKTERPLSATIKEFIKNRALLVKRYHIMSKAVSETYFGLNDDKSELILRFWTLFTQILCNGHFNITIY